MALLDAAEELAFDERPAMRRLGNAIRSWARGDERSLEAALGITAEKGSHNTAQKIAMALVIERLSRSRRPR
jgi:hypothetical protein